MATVGITYSECVETPGNSHGIRGMKKKEA